MPSFFGKYHSFRAPTNNYDAMRYDAALQKLPMGFHAVKRYFR